MNREKKVSVRMTLEENEQLKKDAAACGMEVSEYIRTRALKKVDRIFFDPAVESELRSCRNTVREFVRGIEKIQKLIERDNYVQMHELSAIKDLVSGIYKTMDLTQKLLMDRKKEIIAHGDYKVVEN